MPPVCDELFDLVRVGETLPPHIQPCVRDEGDTASASREWVTKRDIDAGKSNRQQRRTRIGALANAGPFVWLTEEAEAQRLGDRKWKEADREPQPGVDVLDAAATAMVEERAERMRAARGKASKEKKDLVELLHLGLLAPGKGVLQVYHAGGPVGPKASLSHIDHAVIELDLDDDSEDDRVVKQAALHIDSPAMMYDCVRTPEMPRHVAGWSEVRYLPAGRSLDLLRDEMESAAPVLWQIAAVSEGDEGGGCAKTLCLHATDGEPREQHSVDGVEMDELDTLQSRLWRLWCRYGPGASRESAAFTRSVRQAFARMDKSKRELTWRKARCEAPFPWPSMLPRPCPWGVHAARAVAGRGEGCGGESHGDWKRQRGCHELAERPREGRDEQRRLIKAMRKQYERSERHRPLAETCEGLMHGRGERLAANADES
jgi:hypothetical protein